MSELALFGGKRTIESPLKYYSSLGPEETKAVADVMVSGRLSEFIGAYCDEFYGGPLIREVEKNWGEEFQCDFAVSVNSNTSGLIAAMGAVGVGPGDEVIVPPWTMSATALAPLFYGGVPVFADIEDDYFCLSLASVEQKITSKTKAIIAVNLFGHPAELAKLRALADAKGIFLIEDNAQAPHAKEGDRLAGTIGHIGIASLNYHKHIHTGEGGVCTTNDEVLAKKLQLIRNHGENAVEELGIEDITNMVGFNFRMSELAAAIGISQIKKSKGLVDQRIALADRLSNRLRDIDGLTVPKVRDNCTNSYYIWAAKLDIEKLGVERSVIARALEAEGVPTGMGYVKPLYNLPLFMQRKAIGNKGFPFTLSDRNYDIAACETICDSCSCARSCPVVEELHSNSLIEFAICSYQLDGDEIDRIADAYAKVFSNINLLKKL